MAFGVTLELEGIDVPTLSDVATGVEPPTLVRRVALRELKARWAAAVPERVRELRAPDGTLILSVDADPAFGYLVRTPRDGSFLAAPDGREVLCAPLARARASWTVLLVGQVLPLVATLRGLEVFHASAVELGGRALLFTAAPGGGKTSLALQLLLSGGRLLTDDAAAVSPDLRAHVGAQGLGVRSREYARLSVQDRRRLPRPRRSYGRVRYELQGARGAVPVGAFFVLRLRSGATKLAVRRVSRVDPLMLLGSTFNLSVRTPERLRRQLDLCARLAREVPVLELHVPEGVDASMAAEAVLAWQARA